MTTKKLKFEDFQIEQLSKSQQKTVFGGGNDTTPVDPGKGSGGTGTGNG